MIQAVHLLCVFLCSRSFSCNLKRLPSRFIPRMWILFCLESQHDCRLGTCKVMKKCCVNIFQPGLYFQDQDRQYTLRSRFSLRMSQFCKYATLLCFHNTTAPSSRDGRRISRGKVSLHRKRLLRTRLSIIYWMSKISNVMI